MGSPAFPAIGLDREPTGGLVVRRPLQEKPVSDSPQSPGSARLRQAAQDFESILLHSWWQSMKESSFDSSEEDGESSGEILGDWGGQALSSAIAASGGLGLARLLLQQWELEPTPGTTEASRLKADPQVFSAVADERDRRNGTR